MLPSGRLTVPSPATLPLAVAPDCAASGCHAFTHLALAQIHFPLPSPLRLYSVSPWESTSTVAPSAETDAVFTSATEVPLLAGAAGAVEADPLLELELLPQALSNTAEASMGTRNLVT